MCLMLRLLAPIATVLTLAACGSGSSESSNRTFEFVMPERRPAAKYLDDRGVYDYLRRYHPDELTPDIAAVSVFDYFCLMFEEGRVDPTSQAMDLWREGGPVTDELVEAFEAVRDAPEEIRGC